MVKPAMYYACKWAYFEYEILHYGDEARWLCCEVLAGSPSEDSEKLEVWKFIVEDIIQNWINRNRSIVPEDEKDIFWCAISSAAEASNNTGGIDVLGGNNIGINWLTALIDMKLIKHSTEIFKLRNNYREYLEAFDID